MLFHLAHNCWSFRYSFLLPCCSEYVSPSPPHPSLIPPSPSPAAPLGAPPLAPMFCGHIPGRLGAAKDPPCLNQSESRKATCGPTHHSSQHLEDVFCCQRVERTAEPAAWPPHPPPPPLPPPPPSGWPAAPCRARPHRSCDHIRGEILRPSLTSPPLLPHHSHIHNHCNPNGAWAT